MPPIDGSRSPRSHARRPGQELREPAPSAGSLRVAERDVAVRIDERRLPRGAVERERERHVDLDAVLVGELDARAERGAKIAVDRRDAVAGAVGREPQAGAGQVEDGRGQHEIPLVLEHGDVANISARSRSDRLQQRRAAAMARAGGLVNPHGLDCAALRIALVERAPGLPGCPLLRDDAVGAGGDAGLERRGARIVWSRPAAVTPARRRRRWRALPAAACGCRESEDDGQPENGLLSAVVHAV
jgi:hypothetical protein